MTPTLQAWLVGAVVALMMLAVGLRVDGRGITILLHRPRTLGRVLVVNVLVVPAIAVALVWLLPLPPTIAAALVLAAAVPGGPLGPALANLARADVAAAAGFMVVLSIASVVVAPLVVAATPTLGDMALEPGGVASTLLLAQLAPLGIGIAISSAMPAAAARAARSADVVANACLAAVIGGILVAHGRSLANIDAPSLLAMLTFTLASLTGGRITARTLSVARAAALATGIRNIALALLLTTHASADTDLDLAVLTLGVVMIPTCALAALAWRRGEGVTSPGTIRSGNPHRWRATETRFGSDRASHMRCPGSQAGLTPEHEG